MPPLPHRSKHPCVWGVLLLAAWFLTSPLAAADVRRQVIVTGLSRPVYVCQAPGDNDRLFIVEQHTGQIRIFKISTGTLNASPFITIGPIQTGNEQGLLGLAFHPNYQTNGYFYVKRTGPGGNDIEIFERYTRGANADTGDPATRKTLMAIPGSATNHNAGWLAFGPDGYLYMAMGDAGGADDNYHGTIGNGQDRTSFYGKILRVDVNSTGAATVQSASWASNTVTITTTAAHNLVTGQAITIAGITPTGYNGNQDVITVTGPNSFTFPLATNPGTYTSGGTATPGYRIPATNPFAGHATYRKEIWAFGLRNPWRCSFDRLNGDLWIGDVGQNTREEFDRIPAGATAPLNFGWRPREGFIQTPAWPTETPVTTATDPVRDYTHSVGPVAIGGYIYRGSAIPAVAGRYFHADYNGAVWTLEPSGNSFVNLVDRTAELNSGSPTMSGICSFGEDNAGELYIVELSAGRVSKILPLTPTLAITTSSPLPAWTANRAGYSQSFAATGGSTPYAWSQTAGTLPSGLTLSSGGNLTGTPTTAGTFSFTIQVQDATPATTSKAFTVTINPALNITTASPLPAANVGTAYSQTLAVTGGTGAKTWSLQSGSWPTGVTLSAAGVVSGSPAATGTFSATVLVTDTVGATTTKLFSLTVNNNLTVTTATPLSAWTVGRPYSQTFSASGGLTPYSWTITAGAAPTGLNLSSGGVLSGTPTAAATANFTVQVADSAAGTASKAISLTINAAPTITTASPLPAGNVGVAYTQTFLNSGGTAPFTWAITSGSLPTGLSMSSAGVISGTPTAAVTANFTVQITDAAGATATKAFALSTSSAPIITSTAVTTGNLGIAYSYSVVATGNPTPTFSLTAYPAGMTINATSGVISWTPATAGSFNVTVQAANGTLPNATQSFTLIIGDYGLVARPSATPYLNMPTTEAGAIPATLSATGAFSNTTTLTPAPALIPYNVNTPLWSDNAAKTRWIAVPSGQTIDFAAQGNWTFPAGTVLVKHFELPVDDANPTVHKRLETRLLVIKADHTAYGVTYHWRADNSDADLLPGTLDETITIATASGGTRTQTWTYPSRANCLECHTQAAGFVLGPRTAQLNGDHTYPATGQTDNQLRSWNHIGLFTAPVSEAALPTYDQMAAIGDTTATLERRVKSYWAANCMQCHQPGGPTPVLFDARYETAIASQHVINEPLLASNFGIDNAAVVVPKDRWRSILRHRVNSTTLGEQMPPLGRHLTDTAAVAVMDAWIDSLPGTAALPPPVFTPAAGSFTGSVTVTLSDPDGAAAIRYTLDGTAPTAASPLYTAALTVTTTTTIKARAFRAGFADSIVTTSLYTINNLAPIITSGISALPDPVLNQSTTSLTVTATDPDSGPAALTYQWLMLTGPATVTFTPNNSPVANLTTATFTASGTYTLGVVASDGADTATDNITLNVTLPVAAVPPTITLQPANSTVAVGASAVFTITATGTAPLTYQWRRNGGNIPGAVAATYSTPAVSAADNGASFDVVVLNAAGSVTSTAAILTVTGGSGGGGSNPITPSLTSLTYAAPPINRLPIPAILTLTNNSAAPVTVTLTDNVDWLHTVPASLTLGPGATATFTVTADPTGQTGTVNGVLTVTNAPGGATQTIPVTLTIAPDSGKKGGCSLTSSSSGNGIPWAGSLLLILVAAGMRLRRNATATRE